MLFFRMMLVLSLFGLASFGDTVTIVADGVPVVERGIFVHGCVYGKEAAISDHAPIIWESQKMATWNISNRVSHITIEKPHGSFLGHKFKTDNEQTLINEHGEPAIPGKKSEIDGVLDHQEIINEHFGNRLKQIALKIKELFRRHDLNLMAIQEVPNHLKKHTDGQNLQKMIADILAPELIIHYARRPPKKTDWAPDVAVITKPDVKFDQWMVDVTNRLQPFCSKEVCYVAAHMPFPKTSAQANEQCSVIMTLARQLQSKGHATVTFLGDFNRSADHIKDVCGTLDGFNALVRTSAAEPQSCKDNDGTHAEQTIDLMLTIKKAD